MCKRDLSKEHCPRHAAQALKPDTESAQSSLDQLQKAGFGPGLNIVMALREYLAADVVPEDVLSVVGGATRSTAGEGPTCYVSTFLVHLLVL